tara:strand:+ start:750 stop:1487 length:738 start_codon:yes stop_codon:yes gene_type:complete
MKSKHLIFICVFVYLICGCVSNKNIVTKDNDFQVSDLSLDGRPNKQFSFENYEEIETSKKIKNKNEDQFTIKENTENVEIYENTEKIKLQKTKESTIIPKWFWDTKPDEDNIFVTAFETSNDLQLSIDMATLAAKRQLGNLIEEFISSSIEEYAANIIKDSDKKYTKEIKRFTKTAITEIRLKNYKRKKLEIVQIGNEYQTYIKLSYPKEKIKIALEKKIKKNKLLEKKIKIKKAFKELEKGQNK